MDAMKSIALLRKYSACQDCGSEVVGNGKGTVEINDNIFTRTCACGFSIRIDADKEKI